MADYLPLELCVEILLRLPVKTLLKCTCVCKSWKSIITNPSFVTTHLNRSTLSNNNTTDLFLLRQCSENYHKEKFVLRRDNETLEEYAELEFPFHTQNPYCRIVGSCNGLICLSDEYFCYKHNTILYNPSIRKSVTLPIPQVTLNTHGPSMFVLGFGYDAKGDDYKVVRIAYTQGPCRDYIVPPEVELYSLSEGLWRGISASDPPYCVVERWWSQAFMNGAAHWLALDQSEEKYTSILSFDMGNEVFREMALPRSLEGESGFSMSIAVFGESLSVFQYDENRWFINCCSIWVMKEYGVVESWTKQFTIDIQGIGRTLGLRKNGEILLSITAEGARRKRSDGKLVSYHPETQQIKDVGICGTKSSIFVDTYTESLVLLKEVNVVSSRKGKQKSLE